MPPSLHCLNSEIPFDYIMNSPQHIRLLALSVLATSFCWLTSCKPTMETEGDRSVAKSPNATPNTTTAKRTSARTADTSKPDKKVDKKAAKKADKTSASNPQASGPKTAFKKPANKEDEPDYWKSRYDELVAEYKPTWRRPRLNQPYKYKLKRSPDIRTGILSELTDDMAYFKNDSGTELVFHNKDLDDRNRVQFFQKDACHMYAMREMRTEMRIAQAKIAKTRPAVRPTSRPAKVASANSGNSSRPSNTNAGSSSGEPSNNPNDGGSVAQVISYLNRNLIEPKSTRFIKWGPVTPDERGSGYKVQVIYETKAGSLGMIREEKIFFMNDDGFVYQTGSVRQ